MALLQNAPQVEKMQQGAKQKKPVLRLAFYKVLILDYKIIRF